MFIRKGLLVAFTIIILTIQSFSLTVNVSLAAPATLRVPEDYLTIQKAINAASAGDIILVAPGTYPEYVCVNKSVSLKGAARASIITGAGTPPRVVDVKASNVEISGFRIQAPLQTYKGIYVEIASAYLSNVNITDNTIVGGNDAVFYSRSSNCHIRNNTLEGNAYGVRLYDSSNNLVTENSINGSTYYGINFYGRCHHNNITLNTITKGKYGVLLEYTNFTFMYLNMIKSDSEYAVRLSYSYNSTIVGNTVENNKYGVYVWNCSQNQFYYNNFINNTIQVEHYDAPKEGNIWDTNIILGTKGNYWSDYTGVDDGSGIGRFGENRYAGDGVGDTLIPHLQVDHYPLMYPWTPVPLERPVAIFTWSPTEPIWNLPATFNASKSYDADGVIILYRWDFDDGSPIAETESPIIAHIFTSTGDYTVTLTVIDDDSLTNSTSHLVTVLLYKIELDVYTQKEPYGGRGPNQPSDAFAPQDQVILYAQAMYNYAPVENKMVTFEVRDPDGEIIADRSNETGANGIAIVDFRLATNATFGIYTVFAQVSISEKIANDTLTFRVGWIVEIKSIETVDQYGAPKNFFSRGETIYFSLSVENIAFTPKTVIFTVSLHDETNQAVGVADIKLEVPSGTSTYNVTLNIQIPDWTLIGNAAGHTCALTDWPWNEGWPHCPEISTSFYITL